MGWLGKGRLWRLLLKEKGGGGKKRTWVVKRDERVRLSKKKNSLAARWNIH